MKNAGVKAKSRETISRTGVVRLQTMNPSFDPIRVALIGVSGYGGIHLEALRNLQAKGQVNLAAATVINHSEVPGKCEMLMAAGCRIYRDYVEMLTAEAGRIDLCCIPTGIGWHGEMTVAALEAGSHALVEKPAAGTIQEVDQMIRTKNTVKRMVAVGFQHLYHEDYAALKRRVAALEIGRLQEIRVRAAWPRSSHYYTRNEWAGRLRSRGRWILDSPANNAFAHFLMAALHLAGPTMFEAAGARSVEAELYRAQDIESFDTISARVMTDSGVRILFAVTHSSATAEGPVMDLLGENGRMRWEIGHSLMVWSGGRLISQCALMPMSHLKGRMFSRVLSQIQGREPEACTLEEARKHTHLINTLHKAIPIHDIPACQRTLTNIERGTQAVISGIDGALRQAFETGLLFSEQNLPWAAGTSFAEARPEHEFRGSLPGGEDRGRLSKVTAEAAA